MSWISKRRSPRRSSRRLQIEPLESRSLLAVAAFTIDLLEDTGGVPGEKIIGDAVEAGESFFVEIRAQEFHPLYTGLQGVALDISWDPTAIELVPGSFDPQQVITTALPLFLSGTLDSSAGTILDLGGSAFPAWGTGHAIGDGAPERFALLHFRALEATDESLISLAQGASAIATMPVSSLSSASLSFEQQALTILPVEAEPVAFAENDPGMENPPNSPPPDEPASNTVSPAPVIWNCDSGLSAAPSIEPLAPWLTEQIEPDSQQEELYDLIAAAEPVVSSTTDEIPAVDACFQEATITDAVDRVFMGPLTIEQQPPAALRLEELLALIATEINYRATKTVRLANVICP